MFGPASPEEMHAAQILTGLAMALFISIGLVPGVARYAGKIRVVVLAIYLLGCAALVAYVLLRPA